MAQFLRCSYPECELFSTVICSCSVESILLCDEHISQHRKDTPGVVHPNRDLYLPVHPHEAEAFKFSLEILTTIQKRERARILTEHSQRSMEALTEIRRKNEELLIGLNKVYEENTTFLAKFDSMMLNMKTYLSEIGNFGMRTIERDEFHLRILSLKEQNEEFNYVDILQTSKTYWEQLEQEEHTITISHLIPNERDLINEWIENNINLNSEETEPEAISDSIRNSKFQKNIVNYLEGVILQCRKGRTYMEAAKKAKGILDLLGHPVSEEDATYLQQDLIVNSIRQHQIKGDS